MVWEAKHVGSPAGAHGKAVQQFTTGPMLFFWVLNRLALMPVKPLSHHNNIHQFVD
jgi:hypothetical protein